MGLLHTLLFCNPKRSSPAPKVYFFIFSQYAAPLKTNIELSSFLRWPSELYLLEKDPQLLSLQPWRNGFLQKRQHFTSLIISQFFLAITFNIVHSWASFPRRSSKDKRLSLNSLKQSALTATTWTFSPGQPELSPFLSSLLLCVDHDPLPLIQVFIKPISERNLLTKSQMMSIFSNIEALSTVSQDLMIVMLSPCILTPSIPLLNNNYMLLLPGTR